jgi:hypothetical protein
MPEDGLHHDLDQIATRRASQHLVLSRLENANWLSVQGTQPKCRLPDPSVVAQQRDLHMPVIEPDRSQFGRPLGVFVRSSKAMVR